MKEGEISVILQRIRSGDPDAARQLFPIVYAELHRLAAERIERVGPEENLDPTMLVHEAWLRLGGDDPNWGTRTQFFMAAADSMRRILADHARTRLAAHPEADGAAADEDLLLLHEALDALAAHDAHLAELVALRYFAGHALNEAADLLGVPPHAAQCEWAYARAWLFNEVRRLRASAAGPAIPVAT